MKEGLRTVSPDRLARALQEVFGSALAYMNGGEAKIWTWSGFTA